MVLFFSFLSLTVYLLLFILFGYFFIFFILHLKNNSIISFHKKVLLIKLYIRKNFTLEIHDQLKIKKPDLKKIFTLAIYVSQKPTHTFAHVTLATYLSHYFLHLQHTSQYKKYSKIKKFIK